MSDSNKFQQVCYPLWSSANEKEKALHNGNKFPMISFGVSKIAGFDNIYNAVDIALETGYRSFDCEPVNEQEEHLGNALIELLPKYRLQRKDILLTTKILLKDYGRDSTSEAFNRSCEKLQTNYIDMYLMQWPGAHNRSPDSEENSRLRIDTWNEMIKMNSKGQIKNLGVCNFEVRHIEELRGLCEMTPTLNQVEFHPKFPQLELLEYCNTGRILLQAISFKDTYHPLITSHQIVKEVAKSIHKTPAQVLLRWTLKKGVAVVPQSEDPKKIKQSFHVFDFDLEKDDMDAIDSIKIREKYLRNPISVD